MRKIALALAAALLLASCAAQRGADVYTEGSTGGKVLKGVLISARPVTIKAAEKVSDNVLGGAAGGVGGAVAAGGIGGGNGRTVAQVGGAVAGAVLGAYIQDKLSTQDGMEYLIEVGPQNLRKSSSQTYKQVKVGSGGGAQEDVRNSIDTELATDVISVVQAVEDKEAPLVVGQKVYVVYHDDRPRVIAAPVHSAQ